ncbi:hypothetical protein H2203_003872 [Taxawa tesnikishii (nom. ined.)]|nr:hypothetical protein H2203_003872 [Dothideales sp. JES 119]
MSPTIYLVTGANRGLGRGLTAALLQRPNTAVIAAVRDPTHTSATSLDSLPAASGSKAIVIKIDSASETDPSTAMAELQSAHSISHLDVVIANAGISSYYGPLVSTPVAEFVDHWRVNTLGPVLLFQAAWPLLEKSAAPQFVVVSTGVASIGDMASLPPIPASAYASSKAAVNWLTRKMHFEHERLVAFPISPG